MTQCAAMPDALRGWTPARRCHRPRPADSQQPRDLSYDKSATDIPIGAEEDVGREMSSCSHEVDNVNPLPRPTTSIADQAVHAPAARPRFRFAGLGAGR